MSLAGAAAGAMYDYAREEYDIRDDAERRFAARRELNDRYATLKSMYPHQSDEQIQQMLGQSTGGQWWGAPVRGDFREAPVDDYFTRRAEDIRGGARDLEREAMLGQYARTPMAQSRTAQMGLMDAISGAPTTANLMTQARRNDAINQMSAGMQAGSPLAQRSAIQRSLAGERSRAGSDLSSIAQEQLNRRAANAALMRQVAGQDASRLGSEYDLRNQRDRHRIGLEGQSLGALGQGAQDSINRTRRMASQTDLDQGYKNLQAKVGRINTEGRVAEILGK